MKRREEKNKLAISNVEAENMQKFGTGERKEPSVDREQMTDWLAKNPGKGPSDYVLWKAKNSPMAMTSVNLLNPDALDLAAQYYRKTGQLPSGFTRSPQTEAAVIARAAQQAKAGGGGGDIAANRIGFETSKAASRYMTSGAGGKQLTAFNTAITHLDTLERLAGDLNNSNLQVVNKAAQAYAEQTGSPAPANFAAAVNAMSGEVAAALKASGATDQEIAKVGSTFSRSQSPAQLKGAINTYRELLKSKAGQLKRQYQSGMQGRPAFGSEQGSGQGLTNFHVNPQTGETIGWDGKAWVRVQ